MRILYLTPGVFDKGGICRYNRFQIAALRELLGTDRVSVISLLGPSGSQHDLETPFDVDWHGSRADLTFTDKMAFVSAAWRFNSGHRADLIWCAHLHYSVLAWLLARAKGTKYLVQVYGREVWTSRYHRPDLGWGISHSNYIISDCHFTAQYVADNYRVKNSAEVMWDCVETSRFSPGKPSPEVLTRYGLPDPSLGFNILTLGRLSQDAAYKGYERLLEVFCRLPDHAHLIYGGGGSLISYLQKRAHELGVADRVIFTGFIRENDLPDVYRSASVFCLIGDRGPGRGEGIPLTPLEAASCGVPILVGNQDGSREAVEQGINGYALDPFDLDEITRQLQRLATDDAYRAKLGQGARARVEKEHAYPVFRSHVESFLQKIE